MENLFDFDTPFLPSPAPYPSPLKPLLFQRLTTPRPSPLKSPLRRAARTDPTPSPTPFNINALLGLDDSLTTFAEMEDHSTVLQIQDSTSSTATAPDNLPLPDKDDILVIRQTSSQRKKLMLLVNGLPFYKAKVNKNGTVLFRCGGAKCAASITTTADYCKVLRNNLKHCH